MVKITLRLTEELHERLRWVSYREKRSQHAILLELVEKALADVKVPKDGAVMGAESNLFNEILNANDLGEQMQTAKGHALAYCRVSTDRQEERGLSIPAQMKAIEEYAQQNGITILKTYRDAASAFQDEAKRTGFRAMLEEAKTNRQANMLLVHEFSRFSRDPFRMSQLVGELQKYGVQVVSVSEPNFDLNTTAGIMMLKMTEIKNATYSMDVATHTRKGMRQNSATRDPESGWCYKNGGRAPWGYRIRRIERTDIRGKPRFKAIWELDTKEVAGKPTWEWTREFLLRAAERTSLDSLRDFLNETGIPSPEGKLWSTSTLHSLLEPHLLLQYAGTGTWGVRKKRRQKWNQPQEWEVVENAHPAIITEEQAKMVLEARDNIKALYRNRSHRMSRARAHDSGFMLSGGLFRCTRCGSNMAGETNNRKRYYACGSVLYKGVKACGNGVHIPQSLLEERIWGAVTDWLIQLASRDQVAILKKVDAEVKQAWIEQGGEQGLKNQQRLQQIEKSISSLRSAIENGLQDIQWANTRLQELTAEKEKFEKNGIQDPCDPPEVDVKAVKAYVDQLPGLLQHCSNEEKRALVRSFVTDVTLEPETKQIAVGLKAPLLSQTVRGGDRSRTGV